jgi:FkbM family methyltransferase
MLSRLISKALERLYVFDSVRAAKDRVRPLKHLIFGKDDVYLVTALIQEARGAIDPVTVVLDVGAAYGDKTLTFLRVFPESSVHCFEPQSASRARLVKRIARWKDRVVVHEYGLFNENRTVDLRLYSYPDASSLLPIPQYMRDEGKGEVGTETIRVRRLDDCLAELSVPKIDLLKVDVEGVEREVLEGAAHALRMTDNVFVEIAPLRKGPHSADYIAVFSLMHEMGFTLMGQYGDYWFSKDPSVMTTFFG